MFQLTTDCDVLCAMATIGKYKYNAVISMIDWQRGECEITYLAASQTERVHPGHIRQRACQILNSLLKNPIMTEM